MRDAEARLGERLEPVRGDRCPHLVERALHQAEVQLAHDLLVHLGDLAERALPQPELVPRSVPPRSVRYGLRGLRGETELLQGGGQPPHGPAGVRPLKGGRPLGDVAAPLPAGLHRGLARLGQHPRDQAGQHLGQQAVLAPSRSAALDGLVGHAGPARGVAGPGRAGGQARVHERVQVEPGRVGVQSGPACDLPHADRRARGAQQVKDVGAPLAQRGPSVRSEKRLYVHRGILHKSTSRK